MRYKFLASSHSDVLPLGALSSVGAAAFTLRYSIAGKRKEITLGRYPDLTLGEARRRATEKRAAIQRGIDVAREKQRTIKETASAWAFRQLSEDYLTRTAGKLATSTMSGRRQQLRDYVLPRIGHLPAREVSPHDIVDIVERTTHKSLHVARLVLIALREVFAHGIARHVVTENPCAHIKGKAIIGAPPSRRERIMLTDEELKVMLTALPRIGRSNELATRILLVTCARIGELINAEWQHVDFERQQWTVPPERSKNRKIFVIPLTQPALEWFIELKQLAVNSKYVSPIRKRLYGLEGDAPMRENTLNAALNLLCKSLGEKCRRFTPHDLRSTARSHLGTLGVDVLISERCLNHSLGGLVAIYDKHDYLPERRKAMTLWSNKIRAIERGEQPVQLKLVASDH